MYTEPRATPIFVAALLLIDLCVCCVGQVRKVNPDDVMDAAFDMKRAATARR